MSTMDSVIEQVAAMGYSVPDIKRAIEIKQSQDPMVIANYLMDEVEGITTEANSVAATSGTVPWGQPEPTAETDIYSTIADWPPSTSAEPSWQSLPELSHSPDSSLSAVDSSPSSSSSSGRFVRTDSRVARDRVRFDLDELPILELSTYAYPGVAEYVYALYGVDSFREAVLSVDLAQSEGKAGANKAGNTAPPALHEEYPAPASQDPAPAPLLPAQDNSTGPPAYRATEDDSGGITAASTSLEGTHLEASGEDNPGRPGPISLSPSGSSILPESSVEDSPLSPLAALQHVFALMSLSFRKTLSLDAFARAIRLPAYTPWEETVQILHRSLTTELSAITGDVVAFADVVQSGDLDTVLLPHAPQLVVLQINPSEGYRFRPGAAIFLDRYVAGTHAQYVETEKEITRLEQAMAAIDTTVHGRRFATLLTRFVARANARGDTDTEAEFTRFFQGLLEGAQALQVRQSALKAANTRLGYRACAAMGGFSVGPGPGETRETGEAQAGSYRPATAGSVPAAPTLPPRSGPSHSRPSAFAFISHENVLYHVSDDHFEECTASDAERAPPVSFLFLVRDAGVMGPVGKAHRAENAVTLASNLPPRVAAAVIAENRALLETLPDDVAQELIETHRFGESGNAAPREAETSESVEMIDIDSSVTLQELAPDVSLLSDAQPTAPPFGSAERGSSPFKSGELRYPADHLKGIPPSGAPSDNGGGTPTNTSL